MSNRDIGFVHAGQQAEIKVDTFNFTRYGLLHGEVLSVSQDAVIRERQQDRSNDRTLGTQNETSEPKGQELNYSARISLDRTKMADRRQDGQSVSRHGGDRGNQDGIADGPELSAFAVAALPPGSFARALGWRALRLRRRQPTHHV